jgi:SAM-dependent methyltransferase
MKADYGIDAPGVVRNFALAGVAALVAGWFVFSAGGHVPGGFLLAASLIFFVESGWMLFSSRKGKWLMRERLLDLAGLTGHEQVLDVGCGRGLILNGAARRLTAGGRAIGIDLWSRKDQSGNHPERTRENARREGVEERVEIVDGDARSMPFVDREFDVVFSSLCLHNIHGREERNRALAEIWRVLKPGGRFVILDMMHVKAYDKEFRRLGAVDVQVNGPYFLMFPPFRIVTGRKPETAS